MEKDGQSIEQKFQHDLDHPTKDLVIAAYQQFRDTLREYRYQINEENEEVPEATTEPDLIFELLHFVNKYFVFIVQRNWAESLISLIDFYAPTAKRSKIRFKLLFNFLDFYDKKKGMLRDIVMARKTEGLKMLLLKNENEQQKTDLAGVAETLAKNEDLKKKLREDLKRGENISAALEESRPDREHLCKNLQQESNVLSDTYETKQAHLNNLKTNNASLNEQVVTKESYDSLKALKENLLMKCEEFESDQNNIAEGLSFKVQDLKYFEDKDKELTNLILHVKEVQGHEEELNELNTEIQQLQNKFNTTSSELELINETILKINNSNKQKNADFQSSVIQYNVLLQQINNEIGQINIEKREEMELQKKLVEHEAVLKHQELIITQKLQQEREDAIRFRNVTTANYRRIIYAENAVTTNFNKALEELMEMEMER